MSTMNDPAPAGPSRRRRSGVGAGSRLRSARQPMNATDSPKLYGSIAEIRAANKAAGDHWFEKDTLRFFDGIVPEDQEVVHGRFFVSSEQFNSDSPRLHTLRHVNAAGGIDTVGHFQQFETFDDARAALSQALAGGVTVRQIDEGPDADPTNYHWQVHLGDLPIDTRRAKREAEANAAELSAVLASEAPSHSAGDYEIEDSEPESWVCERNVLGEILRFEWTGGIYIEVSCPPAGPQEVINVTDDVTGSPRLERTQQAFEREVDEWIDCYGPEQLRHDVVEQWADRPR